MPTLRIKLVFDDWRLKGKSVYSTIEGVRLSAGDLHSGSTFPGTIDLDDEQAEDMRRALSEGYTPVFWIHREIAKENPA